MSLKTKATAFIATSFDGFIARPNGELDWLPGAEGAAETGDDFGYATFFNSIDAIVMGRHTYEKVLTFGVWPYDAKPVFVLSSKNISPPKKLQRRVQVRNLTPAALLDELQMKKMQHIWVDGGKTIQNFLAAGFLHRLIITRIPVIIGEGIPLFGPVPADCHLRHIKTEAFKNGFVQSHYAVLTRNKTEEGIRCE